MSSNKSIDWTKINEIVHKTLLFLSKPYPTQVNNFLNWYLSISKQKTTIDNPQLKKWIVNGIPKMKLIIQLLNKEIIKVDKELDKILTSNKPLDQKHSESKIYYDGLRSISEVIIEFIGCREKMNSWYLGLLRHYKDVPAVKKNLDFFENTCLVNRKKLLSRR